MGVDIHAPIFFGRGAIVMALPTLAAYVYDLGRRYRRGSASRNRRPSTGSESGHVGGVPVAFASNPCMTKVASNPSMTKADVRFQMEARRWATQQRIDVVYALITYCRHMAALALIFLLAFRHLQGAWSQNYEGQKLSSDPIWPLSCLVLVGIECIRCRRRRFIDAFYTIVTGWFVWRQWDTESPYLMVFRSRGLIPLRMALGAIHPNPGLTLVLNVTTCVGSCIGYIVRTADYDSSVAFEAGHELWFICDEIVTAFVIIGVAYALEGRFQAQAKAHLAEKLSSQAVGTLNTLLTALCDAVVRLSSDFHVLSGEAKLQALLLNRCGDGMSFLTVLDDEDRERFVSHCNGGWNSRDDNISETSLPWQPCHSEHATSLNVRMRDAVGVVVKMQIFTAKISNYANCYEYLLGIRELSREDEFLPRMQSEGSETMALSFHSWPSSRYPNTPTCSLSPTMACTQSVTAFGQFNSRAACTSSGSEPSSGGGTGDEGEESNSTPPSVPANGAAKLPEGGEEVAIWIDAMTLTICHATPAFIGLGGPSTISSDFTTFLKDPAPFMGLVQRVGNNIMNGDASPGMFCEFGLVKLQPPVAVRAQLEFSAHCSLMFSIQEVQDDNCEDTVMAHVVFTDISQKRVRKKRDPRRALLRHARKEAARQRNIISL